jgi:hypothetical protein
MHNELDVSYFLGMSLVPALLAAGLVYWQLGKNPVRLTSGQTTVVILATIVIVVVTFIGCLRVVGADFARDSQSLRQALMLVSALVGYFAGKAISAQMRKSQAGAS